MIIVPPFEREKENQYSSGRHDYPACHMDSVQEVVIVPVDRGRKKDRWKIPISFAWVKGVLDFWVGRETCCASLMKASDEVPWEGLYISR